MVGLTAGGLGAAIGAACAWPVVTLAFHVAFAPRLGGLMLLLGLATLVCAFAGLCGAANALVSRPAPILRI